MKDKEKDSQGLPLKKQLLGGFRKTDVTQYIENLVEEIEVERELVGQEKEQFYKLMKNGQMFCDDLALASKGKAEALLLEAQQKADDLLQAANDQLQQIQAQRDTIITASLGELRQLAGQVSRQQEEANQAYERLLQPMLTLLQVLEGDQDAS